MNNSAYEGLIIGVYVLIFLAALTATVFLFTSVYNYSETAYKFSQTISNKSLIVGKPTEEDYIGDVPKEQEIILKGDELISYYFNYIKFDSYEDDEVRKELRKSSKYIFQIGNTVISTNTGLSYSDLLKYISLDKKYALKYVSTKDGVATITIKIVEETTETGE